MGVRVAAGLVLMLVATGCTSSRWIVQEIPADDPTGAVVRSTEPVLAIRNEPQPGLPVLELEVRDRTRVAIPQRAEARRYVQKYRPRYGWMALGLAGAATLAYIANADRFLEDGAGPGRRSALNITAVAVAGISVFNLKPVGKPDFTGETRLLDITGERVRTDTVARGPNAPAFRTRIRAYSGETVLLDGIEKVSLGNRIQLDLVNEIPFRAFQTDRIDTVLLVFEGGPDELFEYRVPVSRYLKRYVRVERRNTALRASASVAPGNVLTTVAEGSLLEWVATREGWMQVRLGITPAYLPAEDAALVWMPATSGSGTVLAAETRFGDLEVERNIPSDFSTDPASIALVVANQAYTDPAFRNRHAARSADLMRRYVRDVLGVPEGRIRVIQDANARASEAWTRFDRGSVWAEMPILPDSTRLFVYITGQGAVRDGRPVYLPVDAPTRVVDLTRFMQDLANLPTRSTQVVLDMDFTHSLDGTRLDEDALARMAAPLTAAGNAWVLTATSRGSERAGTYTSADFRTDRIYSLLTWYLAEALQARRWTTEDLYRHIRQNVNFTSRRLHDRPQEPRLFGNPDLLVRPTP